MGQVETDARAIVARLLRDGWRSEGGQKHDKFSNPAYPGVKIMVPRHRGL